MSLEPTFYGYVATSNDALLIFEGSRQNGLLQKVSRRPHDRERDRLIKSGNIFVFDEQSSGIRRWTDGVAWSPSRILGNYLIYRQLERPLQPGEKKRAQKHRSSTGHQRSGSDHPELDSPERLKVDLSPGRSPSPREAGGPIRGHPKKVKSDSSSNASDNGSLSNKPRRWSEEQEKELAGSLTDSYGFKEGGLIKKTMSVEYDGTVHHLVSYYTIDDVMLSRLPSPSQDPRLADLTIGSDLMTRTNFRVHPSSEAGVSVTRNSPTQQRTQLLLQHQRRNDDPRHGQPYGPMYNNTAPPIHGQPQEGYPDPNHYPYGPGPQQPYANRYYPQQPQYQLPVYMHGGAPAPPHMMNQSYYPPPPPGPPPHYAPGPPQHPQHQQVDVKRDGPPNQYYSSYNPYPPASNNQAPMYPGHYPQRGPPPPQQQSQPPQSGQMVNQHGYQGGPPENRGPPPQSQGPPRYDGPPPPQQPNPVNGGNSPHHAPTSAPAPPPQQNLPPPPTNAPQTQPLTRHSSTDSPPPGPPPSDSQGSFGWTNWSQTQGSQPATQTRS